MLLTERHIIKKSHRFFDECDHLSFLSKNLYNSTLYTVRQEYISNGRYMNYYEVNRLFTHQNQSDYRALPAKVAKQTQMLVDKAYRSFFALLKKKKSDGYGKKIRLPGYLHSSKGRQAVLYNKDALSFKRKGFINPSKTDIFIQTSLPREVVQFVRIVPHGSHYSIEIGYNRECEEVKEDNGYYLSIDLGVNNLATCSSNKISPFIVNGGPLKSINQYYNKALSQEKSRQGQITSHAKLLLKNRTNKISDYLHKASSLIVNQAVSNGINTIVIGYNKEWKQDTMLGRRNNQNFQGIPFWKFVSMIQYKAELRGISVHLQEESYTSKCSFLDNEPVQKHDVYLGRRVKRGLFRTSQKSVINADLNGSLNILRKYLTKKVAWNENIFSDLVGACSTPRVVSL